jgi:Ala-tRNA(Pro) deacylase
MVYHKTVAMIEALLTEAHVAYEKIEHEPVRTSEEAARVRGDFSLAQGAKALIVRIKKNSERSFVMLVVPGDRKFDSAKVRAALGAREVRFATEDEVRTLTDGVEPGGVPPFGNLWGLPVYADSSICAQERIIFNAGDRAVSITLLRADWERVVLPTIAELV